MAFHVACPITCRRICYCALGFPRPSTSDFLSDVRRLEDFLTDPTRLHNVNAVVRVPVPKVVASHQQQQQEAVVVEDEAAVSSHTKRVALQKKAAAAVVAAEDYARRFESGDLTGGAAKDMAGEEQGQSNANVLCRMCFHGETEGSERARRMLSCKSCGKKYHRTCVKNWARNRDLFHWSSWTCPSCRICEVCRRTGDPNKFMFCRRCDAAHHCYCQHPPHKNVSSGPYLCPKHTRCHSCGSNVPGNGLYVRWFLGYTCCDACGRLFVKGNYCPVCLKVYRDSESTPMVCCDVCQRWVHCHCDGISGERYQQFQDDGNLQYKCATCRGESYQVKDLEDAVQELWRRKDETDRDLIASLRAAAGLPTEEEIFSISPFSDDEDNAPVTYKSEFGRSLRFSLKGLSSKSPKGNKENGKKSSHKKYSKRKKFQASLIGNAEEGGSFGRIHELQSSQDSLGYDKDGDVQLYGKEGLKTISSSYPLSASFNQRTDTANHSGVFKHRFVNEVMMSNEDRIPTLKIKNTNHVSDVEATSEKHAIKEKAGKMKRLVISLGSRKINATTSANSDASSCQREQDSETFRGAGSEDESLLRTSNKFPSDRHDSDAKSSYGDRVDHSGQVKGLKFAGRGGNVIKIGKAKSEIGESNSTYGRGSDTEGYECLPQEHPRVSLCRRGSEASTTEFNLSDCLNSRGDKRPFGKQSECRPESYGESYEDYSQSHVSHSLPKDSKPLLRLKFKKPQSEHPNSHSSHVEEVNNIYKNDEEEKSSVKGQRSKRKRPVFVERSSFNEDEKEDDTVARAENSMDEIMDANWILKKLGKDGVGKRVEVQQSSDNSWHKGVVTDIDGSTSILYVTLDDGRLRTLQLGKQGVRFVSQKRKRSRT